MSYEILLQAGQHMPARTAPYILPGVKAFAGVWWLLQVGILLVFLLIIWWMLRGHGKREDPKTILKRRLAAGEITIDEYRSLKKEIEEE